jgi:PD-(D/E)XK nuclease superfamily
MELQGKDVTEAIIGASFEVYNVLGYGFLEKVCKRSPFGARIWRKCEFWMVFFSFL